MRNIMLDLETLGTSPGSIVFAIGAVGFCPDSGDIGPSFHRLISVYDSLKLGLKTSVDTLSWWSKQSSEALHNYYKAHIFPTEEVPSVRWALLDFNDYITNNFEKDVCIWGNGANFDQPLLRAVYEVADINPVWSPFNERCYRTLKNLSPQIKLNRIGVHHDALADAKSQAAHAIELLKDFRARGA